MKISKNISTSHGDCVTTSEITASDNGQTVIHVVSQLDGHRHEHTITVGAADGVDVLSSLAADALKTHLQKHLDETRKRAADVLAARVRVKQIAAELV